MAGAESGREGRLCRAVWAWGGLGLYLSGGGSPGGLWVEEGLHLTQVLTGTLCWLLWGGQTIVGDGRS